MKTANDHLCLRESKCHGIFNKNRNHTIAWKPKFLEIRHVIYVNLFLTRQTFLKGSSVPKMFWPTQVCGAVFVWKLVEFRVTHCAYYFVHDLTKVYYGCYTSVCGKIKRMQRISISQWNKIEPEMSVSLD